MEAAILFFCVDKQLRTRLLSLRANVKRCARLLLRSFRVWLSETACLGIGRTTNLYVWRRASNKFELLSNCRSQTVAKKVCAYGASFTVTNNTMAKTG